MTSVYFTSSKVGDVLLGKVEQEKVSDREIKIIETEFSAAAPATKWRVALDLSPVMMLTSAGLGMLVTLHKLCKASGGKLTLFGMTPELVNLVKMTHLHRLLIITANRDEALKQAAA